MTEYQPRYWRIRVRVGYAEDLTQEAWDQNQIGIWYGAWTATDLDAGLAERPNDLESYLMAIPAQKALEWKGIDVRTVARFTSIVETDWVVVYLRSHRNLGLARVCSGIQSDERHFLNRKGEVFKYRRIWDKKMFNLERLPDSYQLIPTQGRGNVHEFRQMWEHVKLLADSRSEDDVSASLRQKPFDVLLDFLGASPWESFCYAYLILEEGLIPTGLSIGRTLPAVDIVGRRRCDGSRIIAQCKKDKTAKHIESDFLSACAGLNPRDTAYYFAYGGCVGNVPADVRVFSGKDAASWANFENGKKYHRLLLGDESEQA